MGIQGKLKMRIDCAARRYSRDTPASLSRFSVRVAECVAAEHVKEWDMLARYIEEKYSVPYDWTLTLAKMMRTDVEDGVQC